MDEVEKCVGLDAEKIEILVKALNEFKSNVLAIGAALNEAAEKMYGLKAIQSNIEDDNPRPIMTRRNIKQVRLNENEKKLPKKLRMGF